MRRMNSSGVPEKALPLALAKIYFLKPNIHFLLK